MASNPDTFLYVVCCILVLWNFLMTFRVVQVMRSVEFVMKELAVQAMYIRGLVFAMEADDNESDEPGEEDTE